MAIPATSDDFRWLQNAATDVLILTSGGHTIPAHSRVLALASPVLEKMMFQKINKGEVKISGVPYDAVVDFLRFLYAGDGGRPPETAAAPATVQILVLAHAYGIRWLKRRCEKDVGERVGPESAIDVMKLARLCDAPRLFQQCLAVAEKDFVGVQRSDGWRFAQNHDPLIELEVLQFIEERERRRSRWRREKADQEVFMQLGEAMDCLEHICTEGCTVVGPHDGEPPSKSRGPCTSFRTCQALQLLIRHFAKCEKKLAGGGGCLQCKRMWQLFRLHSSLCDRGCCKVPLCRKFKVREPEEGKKKGDDATWRLLVKKVTIARVMSSLVARKMPEKLCKAWERYRRWK